MPTMTQQEQQRVEDDARYIHIPPLASPLPTHHPSSTSHPFPSKSHPRLHTTAWQTASAM